MAAVLLHAYGPAKVSAWGEEYYRVDLAELAKSYG